MRQTVTTTQNELTKIEHARSNPTLNYLTTGLTLI